MSNTLDVQAAAAVSGRPTGFNGIVALTSRETTERFTLATGQPALSAGGGTWGSGGSLPSSPAVGAVKGLVDGTLAGDGNGIARVIAVCGPAPVGGAAARVTFSNTTTNPIFQSTDGGNTWNSPTTIATLPAGANTITQLTDYVGIGVIDRGTSNQMIVAVGVGYLSSASNTAYYFYTQSNDGGGTWTVGLKFAEAGLSDCCKVVGGDGKLYFVRNNGSNAVECYSLNSGTKGQLVGSFSFPSISQLSGQNSAPCELGNACYGNGKLVTAFFGGTWISAGERTVYYRVVVGEIALNNGVFSLTTTTAGATQALCNGISSVAAGAPALAYNQDAGRFLLVTQYGDIFSSPSSDGASWTNDKASGAAPSFVVSDTPPVLVVSRDRSFVILRVFNTSNQATSIVVTY